MLQGFAVFRTDVRLGSSKETDYKRETEPTSFVCIHFVTTDRRWLEWGATASPPTLGQVLQPQLLRCFLSLSVGFDIYTLKAKCW